MDFKPLKFTKVKIHPKTPVKKKRTARNILEEKKIKEEAEIVQEVLKTVKETLEKKRVEEEPLKKKGVISWFKGLFRK